MIARFAVAYFGGALGGLANSFFLVGLARAGALAALGVSLAPTPTWEWLAPRLLWGGLWGLGHPLLAGLGLAPVRAGLLLSLAPSAAQLLYFLPQAGRGHFGLALGPLAPAVVLVANAVWGAVLGLVVRAAVPRRRVLQ